MLVRGGEPLLVDQGEQRFGVGERVLDGNLPVVTGVDRRDVEEDRGTRERPAQAVAHQPGKGSRLMRASIADEDAGHARLLIWLDNKGRGVGLATDRLCY